jgi:hypothetical protein
VIRNAASARHRDHFFDCDIAPCAVESCTDGWRRNRIGDARIQHHERRWNLFRRPIEGGEPVQMTRFTEGVTTLKRWSPDGRRIVLVRQIGPRSGLWSFQPGKGEPKLLTDFRTGAIIDFRFSLDSKRVFFTYGTSSRDVVLISDFQ